MGNRQGLRFFMPHLHFGANVYMVSHILNRADKCTKFYGVIVGSLWIGVSLTRTKK